MTKDRVILVLTGLTVGVLSYFSYSYLKQYLKKES